VLVACVTLAACATTRPQPTRSAAAPRPPPSPTARSAATAPSEESREDREVSRLEAKAEENRRDPEVVIALGVARAKAGDLRGAMLEFRRAQKLAPKDHRPSYNLGQVALRAGQLEEALAALGEASRIAGQRNAPVLIDLAIVQRKAGKLAASVASLRQALRLERSGRAELNLGLALELQGKVADALQAYRRAASLDAKLAAAPLRAGVLLGRRAGWKEAVTFLRRAVELAPEDADARANLGAALLQVGEHRDAALHLARAIKAREDAPVLMNLGLAHERGGDWARAALAYRRAATLRPSLGEAHLRLALAEARSKHASEAGQAARSALKLDRSFRPALDPVIHELAKTGEIAVALALCDAILAVFPADRVAQHNRRALESMRRGRN
jgi:tetratricopeptide (TPR) repeat protein